MEGGCLVPDPPEVIKQALLQLRQQQSDGRLGVHADDALAGTQGRVSHILVLIGQSLNTHTQSPIKQFIYDNTIPVEIVWTTSKRQQI